MAAYQALLSLGFSRYLPVFRPLCHPLHLNMNGTNDCLLANRISKGQWVSLLQLGYMRLYLTSRFSLLPFSLYASIKQAFMLEEPTWQKVQESLANRQQGLEGLSPTAFPSQVFRWGVSSHIKHINIWDLHFSPNPFCNRSFHFNSSIHWIHIYEESSVCNYCYRSYRDWKGESEKDFTFKKSSVGR